MTSDLHIAQARLATQRAHLAGAEAAALEAKAQEALQAWPYDDGCVDRLWASAAAARRRYWREVSSASLLIGHPWPAAERLGAEP